MAREYHYCTKCNEKTEIWASSRREAERKLVWWSENKPLCRECEAANRLVEACEYLADMELPALTGSPSMVESADMTRARLLAQIIPMTEYSSSAVIYAFQPAGYGRVLSLAEIHETTAIAMIERAKDHICGITDAAWWIEKRTVSFPASIVISVMKELEEASLPEAAPEAVEAVDFETTLRPIEPKTEMIARLIGKSTGPGFDISFPEKDDDFNAAVKAFSPRWNPNSKRWNFKYAPEAFPDIAAEVAAHLIGSGYPVRIKDTTIREMAAAGTFRKSEGRRIDYAGKDCFRVDWRRIDGEFYDEVRKIHGAKWDKENQTVLVPVTAADDLRDFAAKFGFPITAQATAAATAFDEYRRAGMIDGKKRKKGEAVPILDRQIFPDVITIDSSLLD